MSALDWYADVKLDDGEQLGCCIALALFIVSARAHPHMPPRRKSISP
jgi:hypothetical protein